MALNGGYQLSAVRRRTKVVVKQAWDLTYPEHTPLDDLKAFICLLGKAISR